jgi:hypothetical protein
MICENHEVSMRLKASSLRRLLLPVLLCAAPVGAFANQPPSSNLNMAIDLALQGGAVGDVIRADLNMDGQEEALLLLTEGCDGDACPWRLIGADPFGSGYGVVAAGFGAGTGLVETYPDGHVIRSDGVILSWDGVQLLPYHDLLSMAPDRAADAGEVRDLNRRLSGSYRAMQMRVHEMDPFETGSIWRLYVIQPDASLPDEPGEFHLITPEGEMRHTGVSIGRPWLYQDNGPEGIVLRVVSLTRNGLLVETLNE